MICSSCRRQLLSHFSTSKYNGMLATLPFATLSQSRTYHASPAIRSSAPTAPTSRSSPSVTQPLTAPQSSSFPGPSQFPAPQLDSTTPNTLPPSSPKRQLPISKTPGGEPLRGLSYLKNQTQVLAKEDSEYPDWLWDLLDENKTSGAGVDEYGLEKVDYNALTKKQRAKLMKKRQALLATMPKIIPPHEQSTDLTGQGATPLEHLEKRDEVVKSARQARRKSLRERNYLGGI